MKVLDKKLFRALWLSRGQSVAVAMVVLCGTACYISIASAHRNLLLTRDTYYARYRFADFEIHLERAPLTSLFKLETIPGVRKALGRIVKDVNVDIEGEDEPRVGRIVSLPNEPREVLDDICLMDGRYFSEGAQNEVILSERFARENRLDVGDSIKASVDNKKYTLRIVGLALSPEYVYMIRTVQELIPSPERFGILWVSRDFAETTLDMKDACNNIVGTVEDPHELDAILDKAEKTLHPYGVFAKLKREDQISNRFLSDEIKGLEVTARIIPPLFQGIAALILMVLLNRMVRKERTEIGLLKAYGYSSAAVAWHYLQYALLLSAAGCVGGFFAGQWLASGMVRMYVDFFEFPLLRSRIYPDVLIESMGTALVFAVVGALSAVMRAARIQPAESMRAEAPRYAHRVLLERFAAVWRRLSFTWKMIARNVSRNRFRAALNVSGAMISCSLLVMGFFMVDSMDFMLRFQFEDVQRQDMRVSFATERGRDALYEVMRFDHVRHAEPQLVYPFELKSTWRTKDIGITGLPGDGRLQQLLDSRQNAVPVGQQGLILSDKLAEQLQVRAGDRVIVKPLMGRITKPREVTVSRVVEQYLGSSAYMNLDALSRLLEEPFVMNAALLRTAPGQERAINRALKDVPGVAAVEIKQEAYQSMLDTLAQNMQISNIMVIIFAAVIACSIIYNITTVSLAERQRELASLRVLGFSVAEVGRILYHENFALSMIGIGLGLPLGKELSRVIVKAYDTELFRLPFHIDPATYGDAAALTFGFVVLANLAVRRKIGALDMVEVLKERE